ncbi:ferredoxin family protein [Umezawaea sp. Da 62-37]|nr:ferredoxin family protein [Umezawaea sp. Da 62-37]WNV86619.1 ferredoxin family protein [Umezawaea sp. Da 62-37]
MDCFYVGENMLVINPDECIDCGACQPECPTGAIFEQDELPAKWKDFARINVEYSEKWPNIHKMRDRLPGSDEAAEEQDKTKDFYPKPGLPDAG